MRQIKLNDKTFELFIPAEKISEAIDAVALKMNQELSGKNPLFISILNGAFMFTSDLMKRLGFNCQITFLKLSTYSGTESTGQVRSLIGLDENIEGRTVVIIEDIIDTGFTLENVIKQLQMLNPAEIKIATFLLKPEAFHGRFQPDYVGLEIPNDFIVGYGLDYNELGRNLTDIYVLKRD